MVQLDTSDISDAEHLIAQVVWGTTTNVGIAVASDAGGSTYVVARYTPPGNL